MAHHPSLIHSEILHISLILHWPRHSLGFSQHDHRRDCHSSYACLHTLAAAKCATIISVPVMPDFDCEVHLCRLHHRLDQGLDH